jgi:hypothetical protein
MTRILVWSLCGIATLSPPAFAQSPPVSVDQRVRVRMTDSVLSGRVLTVSSDSMRLAVEGGDPLTLAMPAVKRIEISRGRSRSASARKGAIRGAIIAGVIGAISLGLQHDQVGEDGSSAGKAAALGAWSGGLFG